MADTGWVSPGTVTTAEGDGTQAWSDSENIKTTDESYAVATLGQQWIRDRTLKLIDSASGYVGDNQGGNVDWGLNWDTTTYGGGDDMWGNSFSASDVNSSSFGIAFQVWGQSGSFVWSDPEDGAVISHYLEATNFSFNIPVGSTIDGVEARIIRRRRADMLSFAEAQVDSIEVKVHYTTPPTVGVGYPLPPFAST